MNPYESPTTAEPSQLPLRQFPFDIGKVVGRYLQLLGLLAITSSLANLVLHDHLHIDLIPILMLIFGHHLTRHRPGARAVVIGVLTFSTLLIVVMMAIAIFRGTEGMTVGFLEEIENPPLSLVLVHGMILLLIIGVPLWLLLTPQARAEFPRGRQLKFQQLDGKPDDWTDDDDS